MLDPRGEAVLILNQKTGRFEDKTGEISQYERHAAQDRIRIVFNSGRSYSYGVARVRIVRRPKRVMVTENTQVEVEGVIWASVREVVTFTASDGAAWSRVFYQKRGGDDYRTYPAARVRVLASATVSTAATEVLNYWREIIARLPDDDPLTRKYDFLDFIHPESVLGSYLSGAPIESRDPVASPIFPFRCNLSQRSAVAEALTSSVSVIEGPPGTGKTETILNLIANIIAVEHRTVAVVSYTNSAVDNVLDKLDEAGFSHVIANLGKSEKRAEFFGEQDTRNARVAEFAARAPQPPEPEQLADVDTRLGRLQSAERARAERRHEVDAYRLELRHFERHLRWDELPDLERLPLLRRSAARVLDYLAESELEHDGRRAGLLRRIRKYFKYGSLRGLDPSDTSVVLRLQRAYYDKRIAELDKEIDQLDQKLRKADFDQLAREHQRLSAQLLHAELGAHYRRLSLRTYRADTYKRGKEFNDFIQDYPALLSTCHSLRDSIANGYLLDYLIIDEASQVDPLVAGLAMSCCRNLVVVGDTRQLSPIPPEGAQDLVPPSPAYDCAQHSILTSLMELHGDALPRTLLREHYRCDPAIIGFCNKKFYRGDLIPYTTSDTERAMLVVRTAEGNHMRQHRGGGRSNQREIDVIETEVIPEYCRNVDDADIGITTPYRLQANKAGDVLDQIQAATVHKFQGRQKEMVILTTVLDETWRGRTGLRFVDDPQLINVAVSRAVQRFILVLNNELMPTSRHIHDLVGHIRYQDPDEDLVDSAVVSVFDLLYSRYSHRLRSLASRLKNESQYKSEDIVWTVLHDILSEDRYAHLTVACQVLLRNLFSEVDGLTPRQQRYIHHRASVDFMLYNRVTNRPLLAIEVDGFAYHENNPPQLERDAIKNEIFQVHRTPLLRLATTGSGEDERIRQALAAAETHWTQMSTH